MTESTPQHTQCEQWKGNILKNNNVMQFMLSHMRKVGCPLQKGHYICRPCKEPAAGHFTVEEGVILCEDKLITEQQTADTMIHETIHAFDHCRVNIDWTDCAQHACSEIRAANLSGDCSFSNEIGRGNYGFFKQHQVCVKRRALLAIMMNENCKGKAEETVDQVFENCFKDTSPFDEIY